MLRHCFVLLLLSATINSVVKCEIYRLPQNVKPVRYMLEMEPDLTFLSWSVRDRTNGYSGSVTIEIKALVTTRNITLHAENINIVESSIAVVDTDRKTVQIAKTSTDTEADFYIIHLENDLVEGEFYNLTIGSFSGELGHGEGFYLARYWNNTDDGEPKGILAATHFEPNGARKAFPCFDEPALKARFIINLIRKEGYVSLSNEELEKTENLGGGRFRDTFKETPQMSTFTLAFTVSDFISTEKLERHRIFAVPSAIKNGELDYALKTSVKTLQVLEEFTGINFTLNKMDSFAVPRGYFHEHAMENWGLVIYGEEHIRFDNKTDSVFTLKRITTYIAHEFGHQWFGNLVTAEWWDYLWLSESFAAYCQYYIASLVRPEWRLMDQFLIDMVIFSLKEEETSYRGTQPLNTHIERSGEYPFFHIMYQKGASVVRMMSHFLTNDIFRKGLNIHLERKKFSTVVPSDLYSALQQAVDKEGATDLLGKNSVADILKSWDSVTGYPIVTVTRNYETGSINLVQSTKFNDTEKEKIWKIPINHIFSSDDESGFLKTSADFWLTEKSKDVNNNFPVEGWLLVNKQQTGYYRVNYDNENWERIIKFLKSDKFNSIHVLNRAQLLNDAFYLAAHGELSFDIAYRLSEYLVQEKDYIPWAAFYEALSSYSRIYSGSTSREPKLEKEYFKKHPLNATVTPPKQGDYSQEYKTFQQFIRVITKNLRDYLGDKEKPNESILDKINRNENERYFPYYFEKDEERDYKLLISLLDAKPAH